MTLRTTKRGKKEEQKKGEGEKNYCSFVSNPYQFAKCESKSWNTVLKGHTSNTERNKVLPEMLGLKK